MEERSGEIAQALWKQLGSKLGERPAASEAVHDAAASPDDADAQAALRVQLRKLLAEDTDLAGQLTRILEESQPHQSVTTVTASGAGSVAAGRDIQAGTIITGDRNRVT
jgi:hypothetical protein